MTVPRRVQFLAAALLASLFAPWFEAPAQTEAGPSLPEIPTDESTIPADWLALVCWNVQVGGVSTSSTALRPPMVREALGRMFSGTYQILAAQEVSSTENAEVLRGLLPGGFPEWTYAFFDTTDTMDNGFWWRNSVATGASSPLFVTSQLSSSGKIVTDPSRAVHPPIAVHMGVGDFDFTVIGLHLTFEDGNTDESAREMRVLLDYLDAYFQQPVHDPDVILCGDFNIPSASSGQTGKGGMTIDGILAADPRFAVGERKFSVLVHEPTSRMTAANGGLPANNYDHFVVSADVDEELAGARRLVPSILMDHPDDPEARLTSDHFPIVGFFRTRGPGIRRDLPLYTSVRSAVSGASFLDGIVAGSWITLFGKDLASPTRTWRPDEIVGDVLPIELDGVRVNIGGKPSAVYYVSPSQLNVQAPSDLPEGPVEVTVWRDGNRLATFNSTVLRYSPGLFLFQHGGNKYVAAVQAVPEQGRIIYVGRTDLFGGALPSRPVKAGDQVLLFGTGFGPTSPAVPSGRLFVGAASLTRPVRIWFGEREATVAFAGLSGAGLYQFNVIVPNGLPSGDVSVIAEIEGARTQPSAFITVQ